MDRSAGELLAVREAESALSAARSVDEDVRRALTPQYPTNAAG